jgi:uncharacterized protein (TIGR02598 family)
LVEVVFSMCVMTFACVVLLGLLAGGVQTVHQAISTTVQAEIMQNISYSAEIQNYNNGIFTNSAGASPAVFYFDDEGTPLTGTPATYAYMATVTSTNAYLPNSTGTPSTSGTTIDTLQPATANSVPGVAALLQVVITIQNSVATPVTNTMLWPNTAGGETQ